MNRRVFPMTVLALFLSGVSGAMAQEKATAKAEDDYKFSNRVYQLGGRDLTFVSREKGTLRAMAMPPASASAGEMETWMLRNHDVLRLYLQEQSLVLPPGSLAVYDNRSGTLALRTLGTMHGMMDNLVEILRERLTKQVQWKVEIIEAPAAEVLKAMQSGMKGSASKERDELEKAGKWVTGLTGITRPGNRTRSAALADREQPVDYTVQREGQISATKETLSGGTMVEIDTVISDSGSYTDVNIWLTHEYGPTQKRLEAEPAGGANTQVEWSSQLRAELTTSVTVSNGMPLLLGGWRLDGLEDVARAKGAMQAAFLTVNTVPLIPNRNPAALELLKKHGEVVMPTPKVVKPVADPNLPPGMIVRRFRVPPDFISIGGQPSAGAAPSDPFAPAVGGVPGEPRFMREVTVQSILQDQGIYFPKGSSANFIKATGELIIRNTPGNIEQVEAFVTSLKDRQPKQVALHARIVQAPTAMVRGWERKTFGTTDHSELWDEIQSEVIKQTASVVDAALVITKPGTRATSKAGLAYVYGGDLNEVADTPKPVEGKPTEPPQAAPAKNQSAVFIDSNTEEVGLSWEVDPVVGVDNETVDINLALTRHMAPPARSDVAQQPNIWKVPQTTFFKHKTTTSMSTLRGTARLVSIWKPTGKAELDGDVLQVLLIRNEVMEVGTKSE
jgi:hypothetical protein